jgi:hypothetical protein
MADRTPDEIEESRHEAREIEAALDRAVDNYASWLVAEWLGLDDEDTELWVDRCYDDLRDSLDHQQLIRAVLFGIGDKAEQKARRLIADIQRGEPR